MEKDMDIIEVMETPISEIGFETKKITIRTISALRKTYKNINVCNLLYLGEMGLKNIKNLGAKGYQTIKNKLLTYGIDIENKYQCNYLVQQYIEKKQKEIKNVTSLLNTKLKDEYSIFATDTLKTNGYETFYDIILEDKDIIKEVLRKKGLDYREIYYTELKLLLIKHGIDLNNEKQCGELLEQYESERITRKKEKREEPKKTKKIIELEQEKQLEIISEDNETLEEYLVKQQEILEKMKKEKKRREFIEQQKAACDMEFIRLIEEYNSIDNKINKTYGIR